MNFYPQNISQKNVYQRNLHMIFTMVVALDKGMGVCLVNVYLMNFHPQNIFPRNVFFLMNAHLMLMVVALDRMKNVYLMKEVA